jgi:hypothetical protein
LGIPQSNLASGSTENSGLFEILVDELLKDKPDSRRVKSLCSKLGIVYTGNHSDQIDEILKNGSKVYLRANHESPKSETENAENI